METTIWDKIDKRLPFLFKEEDLKRVRLYCKLKGIRSQFKRVQEGVYHIEYYFYEATD